MNQCFTIIGPDGNAYRTRPVGELAPRALTLWCEMAEAEARLLQGEDSSAFGEGVCRCLTYFFGEDAAARLISTAAPEELLLITAPLFRYYLFPAMAEILTKEMQIHSQESR